MSNVEKPTDKCSRCPRVLPITDDKGNPNFVKAGNKGSVGFGIESKYVCNACDLALKVLRSVQTPWGN